ncbi:MAG: hypothetical protein U0997_00730 [Sulfurimicrobium sp.]|nr:hypothetical protein [Sulfurimicrobium sp.]
MNATILQDTFPSIHEDSHHFGKLLVTWHAELSPLGWIVHCHLALGTDNTQAILETLHPSAAFCLQDEGEAAWGRLLFKRDKGENQMVLSIAYRIGPSSVLQTTLRNWQVCSPCGHKTPVTGEKTLGEEGWLRIAWTIAGAEEACLGARLIIGPDEKGAIGSPVLTPMNPEWSKVYHQDERLAELIVVLKVADDGTAGLETSLVHADAPEEHAILANYPAPPIPPTPHSDPTPADVVIYESPKEFASFAYPRGLHPPTLAQWARRFAEIDNNGAFQSALRGLFEQKAWPAMEAESQDFIAPESKKYPGQYVRRIADLPAPMGRLERAPVSLFLASRPTDLEELKAKLEQLLSMSAINFLAQPDYASQLGRLQDSLIAQLILAENNGPQESALIQALIVCHIAALVAQTPELLSTPEEVQESLAASALLPATIFPLAPPNSAPEGASYARPLGFADIQIIKQHLLRYRLGEIAHVENVMRGETKERNERHSRRIESREREIVQETDSQDREQGYKGRSQASSETVDTPLDSLKREFDNLQEQYASDGLSVTMSGSWTDSLSGPAQLSESASDYARRLLDRAAARVARRTESERLRRSVEEFVEQNLRRFDNATGNGHVVGVYRWIDEIHAASLENRGSRLVLEFVIPSPSADYVRHNNLLHGLNLDAPIPPWKGGEGIAPILSAADISRSNYAALAARYNATAVETPPPESLLASVSLQSDPPHPLARLDIPEGYQTVSGSVGYCWSGTAPQPLDVLVGNAVLKIDPVQSPSPGSLPLSFPQPNQGSVPVSVLSTETGYAINVTLVCACPDDGALFQRWRMATYQIIMAAYQARKEEYLLVMERFSAEYEREASDSRRETERTALRQAATECLIAPFLAWDTTAPAWHQDTVNFNLIPFFRRAFDWGEMTYTFHDSFFSASDTNRPAWLTMAQARERGPGFSEFLGAGAARLLVPVQPGMVLSLLFYLASHGRFWYGAASLAPVHETNWFLANELKSLLHEPLSGHPEKSWEMEVATSLLMLQEDGCLPDYPGNEQGKEA